MIKIEEGKFYKTRDGRKVGPIKINEYGLAGADGFSDNYWYTQHHLENPKASGFASIIRDGEDDLIEEWSDAPEKPALINIITRRKIVHGSYGIVNVDEHDYVSIPHGYHTPDELREAAHILNQIAEYLESQP